MFFKEIYKLLKTDGFDVYSIGQHGGLCTKPYVVIKELGEVKIAGTPFLNEVIDLLIYYPMPRYSEIGEYCDSVMESLEALECIERTYKQNATIVDDDKKAYTTSITYAVKKMRKR